MAWAVWSSSNSNPAASRSRWSGGPDHANRARHRTVVGRPQWRSWERLGDQQGHLDRWVEFVGPEPGADSGVAAAVTTSRIAPSPRRLKSGDGGHQVSQHCWTRGRCVAMRRTTSTGWPAGLSSQSLALARETGRLPAPIVMPRRPPCELVVRAWDLWDDRSHFIHGRHADGLSAPAPSGRATWTRPWHGARRRRHGCAGVL